MSGRRSQRARGGRAGGPAGGFRVLSVIGRFLYLGLVASASSSSGSPISNVSRSPILNSPATSWNVRVRSPWRRRHSQTRPATANVENEEAPVNRSMIEWPTCRA